MMPHRYENRTLVSESLLRLASARGVAPTLVAIEGTPRFVGVAARRAVGLDLRQTGCAPSQHLTLVLCLGRNLHRAATARFVALQRSSKYIHVISAGSE